MQNKYIPFNVTAPIDLVQCAMIRSLNAVWSCHFILGVVWPYPTSQCMMILMITLYNGCGGILDLPCMTNPICQSLYVLFYLFKRIKSIKL